MARLALKVAARLRQAWVAGILLSLTACHHAPTFRGVTNITGVPWGGYFTLTDMQGRPFDTAQLRGKVILLYFGYIRCTDVCVPTLRRLGSLVPKLGPVAQHTAVVFVSVDPHDTPARLQRFLSVINPSFVGLTGSPSAVAAVLAKFRVAALRNPEAAPKDRYDHSDGIYIQGPHGHVRLYAPDTMDVVDLRHDIRALLR